MSIPRIIDANANRAREALRVMEEAARFIAGAEDLARALKSLRHELADLVRGIDVAIFHRDVAGDVGTTFSTPSERSRSSAADVAAAAGRRLGEALRAIEEYGKTIDADWASRIEKLRYRAYDLELRLARTLGAHRRGQWRVCVVVSEVLCPGGDWSGVAAAAIEAGADCIQLREKELADAELLRRARALVAMAHPRAAVVVNDRPDVALLSGADGVHLGQSDLACADARKLAGRGLLVGVSTSRLAEAQAAHLAGADYCGVGPMFPSTTKAKDRIAGPRYMAEYAAWNALPHLAIGGVTPENVDALVAAGCRGVAVSSAVCAGDEPATVVKRLREALGATLDPPTRCHASSPEG